MDGYFVYMIFCRDGSYYVGVTNDVERRVWEHNEGLDDESYTYSRRPVVLAYSTSFDNIGAAIDWEKKLKRWSHRKKSALARGDWKMIGKLAKGRHRHDRASKT